MSAVALQSFGFGEQLVRVVDQAGSIWFVGKDVCSALEIGNSREALRRLEEDEKGVITTDTLGGPQEVAIISESGLYALIFRSRKPVAVQFRKWVTGEVLPEIRRTGSYQMSHAANDRRTIDLEGALGTADERHTIKTAMLMVQMYNDLYGQQAGRDIATKLGFPVPRVHLTPANPAAANGFAPVEGDIHQWSQAAGLKPSRRDATHLSDLYASYSRWCGVTGAIPMHPDKFKAAMVMLFNHEEHPEMIRVVLCRQ
jgi:prophage antirepressor-like protein